MIHESPFSRPLAVVDFPCFPFLIPGGRRGPSECLRVSNPTPIGFRPPTLGNPPSPFLLRFNLSFFSCFVPFIVCSIGCVPFRLSLSFFSSMDPNSPHNLCLRVKRPLSQDKQMVPPLPPFFFFFPPPPPPLFTLFCLRVVLRAVRTPVHS